MLLGDLLAGLREETTVGETLMALGDLNLMVGIDAAARRTGETTASYAMRAVHRFANQADDGAWLDVVGALGRADDPAAACLSRMLAWSLRSDDACATCDREPSAISGGE